MATKTPGIWDEIPPKAEVTATLNDITVKGTLVDIRRADVGINKVMKLLVPALGVIALDSTDKWEVSYEATSAAQILSEAEIGSVWGTPLTFFPRLVKISEGFVTRQETRSSQPVIQAISNYGSVDAETIKVVVR